MFDDKYLEELIRESRMLTGSDPVRLALPKIIEELKFLRNIVSRLAALANRDDKLVLEMLDVLDGFYKHDEKK
jgi:hypothetical protein